MNIIGPAGVMRVGVTVVIMFLINLTLTSSIAARPLLATVSDLKIAEVQVGVSGASEDEFVELYNPTDSTIAGLSGTTLHLHIVNSTGTEDRDKDLGFVQQ